MLNLLKREGISKQEKEEKEEGGRRRMQRTKHQSSRLL